MQASGGRVQVKATPATQTTPILICVSKMADSRGSGARPAEDRVCSVCYVPTSSDEFFSFSACRHSFCRNCVKHTFDIYIREGKSNIQCLQCSKLVSPQEVASVVDHEQFLRYLDFCLRRYLALQPNVRRCIAPDCPYLYILENRSSCSDDHFVCRREGCGREFCVNCKRPWHEGKSCQQAKEETALDVESLNQETLSKFAIKPCPRCHTNVEKLNDGSCNQVHCTNCNGDFCWLCLQPITEMHFLRYVTHSLLLIYGNSCSCFDVVPQDAHCMASDVGRLQRSGVSGLVCGRLLLFSSCCCPLLRSG